MRKAVTAVITTMLAAALVVAGAVVLVPTGDAPSADLAQPAGPAPSALLLPPVTAGGSLRDSIANLQERLRVLPRDSKGFASLGLLYVVQGRVTADPTYYPKAEGVLQESLQINGEGNFMGLVGMGALALARHDFAGALIWGLRAVALNPYNAEVYGVIGDAQLELGRYEDAFASFQKMVDTRPGLSSYARVSYARELQGDVQGAIAAMQTASDAAGLPSDAAWASFQVGELYWNSGQVMRAAEAYRRATKLAPEYVPPLAGLAKVAWANGDLDRAISLFTEVVQRYPSPEYVIALGDLYHVMGKQAEADQQYALVRAEQDLLRANGVNVDLEIALFDADHGSPKEALVAARDEWARRQSIHVADALAWALQANGEYVKAARYARKALALGMRNALFMFHAGMIQFRLGNEATARDLLREALATNPNLSILYAQTAKDTLAKLEGRG
jgi:tetratricopeptide (TPR) repeat protein